jgi:hypothetical protein
VAPPAHDLRARQVEGRRQQCLNIPQSAWRHACAGRGHESEPALESLWIGRNFGRETADQLRHPTDARHEIKPPLPRQTIHYGDARVHLREGRGRA